MTNVDLMMFFAWGAMFNDWNPVADFDCAVRMGLVWC